MLALKNVEEYQPTDPAGYLLRKGFLTDGILQLQKGLGNCFAILFSVIYQRQNQKTNIVFHKLISLISQCSQVKILA